VTAATGGTAVSSTGRSDPARHRPVGGTSGLPSATSPWRAPGFWLLQVIVLALALTRLAVTVAFHLGSSTTLLELSTVAVFAVPVVVASLAYGLSGGLVTTGWVAVLCLPRVVEAATHHRSGELWAEVVQLMVLLVVAVLIGRRVTAETRFRDQADAARKARLRAELLYQDMFESTRSPILIVDAEGNVVESNAAADHLFGPGGGDGRRRLVDVAGPQVAALVLPRLVADVVPDPADGTRGKEAGPGDVDGDGDVGADGDARLSGGDDPVPPVAFAVDGRQLLYRPTATPVGMPGTDRRMQVVFEDVTVETRRHDLMEAYAGQVVLGQEEERRHLAQELHDGPLQTLIHLCRQIDALEWTGEAAGGGSELSGLRTTVEETVAELRSIARGLRPSVLDDLGLVASLNQVVQEATRRQGFESSFEVDGPITRLPAAVELAVFRIGQEAVTNVERHADARHLSVRLAFTGAGLGLTVADDGSGFDRDVVTSGDDSGSLGLPGMRERARLVGGRLQVRSRPGEGTTVTVSVPMHALEGA